MGVTNFEKLPESLRTGMNFTSECICLAKMLSKGLGGGLFSFPAFPHLLNTSFH